MIIVATLLLVAVAVGIFALILVMDSTYFQSPQYTRHGEGPSDVLVVYYSRSGNTAALAREIARGLEADTIRIESREYPLDFKGWRNAAGDALKGSLPEITPEVVDLKKYRLVFLGAPIWFWRPAPPLWTFVEKNSFIGKNVVVFNTFNSGFKEDEMEVFRKRIREKGGSFIDHVFVRRGRIIFQMTGKELIKQSQQLVKSKVAQWKALIRKPHEQ